MRVYIKDMNMPKSCRSCDMPLSVLKCPIRTKEEAMWYRSCRHKDCPLVPVQSHGKLIDAERLLDTMFRLVDEETFRAFCQVVNDAPTVIPAEDLEDQ